MYLLYTFETKLLTITHFDCISHNKLFKNCSNTSVYVISHVNYTVSKILWSILKKNVKKKCNYMFHLAVVYVDTSINSK